MTRGENDFAHVRFSLRKEMSGEIFVKGRRHWVPEDGSHGCFITERGGSGAGVWKHLSDGQETSPIRSPTLITRILGAGIFIACDFFLSQYCMGVLLLFPVSLLFFIFCPPPPLFRLLLHPRMRMERNFLTVHPFLTIVLTDEDPKRKKYHPSCQPEPTAFTSGLRCSLPLVLLFIYFCFSTLIVMFLFLF